MILGILFIVKLTFPDIVEVLRQEAKRAVLAV